MDGIQVPDILQELEVILSSHDPRLFPALGLLYNNLRDHLAEGGHGALCIDSTQVCATVGHCPD